MVSRSASQNLMPDCKAKMPALPTISNLRTGPYCNNRCRRPSFMARTRTHGGGVQDEFSVRLFAESEHGNIHGSELSERYRDALSASGECCPAGGVARRGG